MEPGIEGTEEFNFELYEVDSMFVWGSNPSTEFGER
jgi:hypothetical protein